MASRRHKLHYTIYKVASTERINQSIIHIESERVNIETVEVDKQLATACVYATVLVNAGYIPKISILHKITSFNHCDFMYPGTATCSC